MSHESKDAISAKIQSPQPSNKGWIVFALFVVGFGIGWLTGLSASPVVNIVIAAIVGVIAALAPDRVMSLNGDKKGTVTSWVVVTFGQLAWIVSGIIVGTSIGMIFRTHDLLNTLPWLPRSTLASLEVRTWAEMTKLDEQSVAKRILSNTYPYRDYSLELTKDEVKDVLDFWSSAGITRTVVAERLFSIYYPADATANPLSPQHQITEFSAQPTVLYAASVSVCKTLRKNLILYSDDLQAALRDTPSLEVLSTITDTDKLRTFVQEIVCDLTNSSNNQ